MKISHKTQAALQFLVPVAVIYLAFGVFLLSGHWPSWALLKENSSTLVTTGLAAMLIQDLVPKQLKEVLVFWRRHERLPGHRAFSEIAFSSPNIDTDSIVDIELLRSLDAEKQQWEFYKHYSAVRENPAVSHLSQRYIAWRDTAALLFLLCCVSIPLIATIDESKALSAGLILSGISAFFFLLTVLAARNSAYSLVIQVLSLPISQEATSAG